MARPTKLTPVIAQAITAAVSGGVPYLRAAALAGIEERTALLWLARGQRVVQGMPPKEPFIQFFQAITQARAQDEARRVLRINQAGQGGQVVYRRETQVTYRKTTTYKDGSVTVEERSTPGEERYAQADWAADAWHLERSRPDDWGRKDRVDLRLTIERAAQQVADELGLTKEEVLAEAEALLKAADTRA